MDLELRWHAPVLLRDAGEDRLIYSCDELDLIPEVAGVYVFGRLYGDRFEPLYIGKAVCLRRRIQQHFKVSVQLMRGIENARAGSRVVVVGEWIPRSGQQVRRSLPVIERALIKMALAKGYEILNSAGTKTPVHTLSLRGSRIGTRLFGTKMSIERADGKGK